MPARARQVGYSLCFNKLRHAAPGPRSADVGGRSPPWVYESRGGRVDQHGGQVTGGAGEAREAFHDATLRNVKASRLQ